MKTKSSDQVTSLDIPSAATHKTYAAQLCGDGKIIHLEERIGKKLLRTIDPISKDGKQLLNTQKVLFHMPDGELLRDTDAREAYHTLKKMTLDRMEKYAGDQELKEMFDNIVESIAKWEKLYIA